MSELEKMEKSLFSIDEFENFTVEIQEDGTYEIICKGWKAKGNIEFEIQ